MARDVLIDDGAGLIYLGFIAVDVECKAVSDLYIYASLCPDRRSLLGLVDSSTALSSGALPNRRAKHVEQLDRYQ
jgi:hypothetical protein